MALEQTSN